MSTFTPLHTPRRMHDTPVLVKRYIYDLNEVVADIAGVSDLADEDVDRATELARAWVVEHLHEDHYVDFMWLSQDTRVATWRMRDACWRLIDAIRQQLYRLFRQMAYHVCNCDFFDVSFRHDILTVAVYEYR